MPFKFIIAVGDADAVILWTGLSIDSQLVLQGISVSAEATDSTGSAEKPLGLLKGLSVSAILSVHAIHMSFLPHHEIPAWNLHIWRGVVWLGSIKHSQRPPFPDLLYAIFSIRRYLIQVGHCSSIRI